MRFLRLLPALLLAVAGCVVNTDELKPKLDAECQAADPWTKACGPRCVPDDDPATGCGAPGDCAPCPAGGANVVAACVAFDSTAASRCGIACAPGWANCNYDPADGCERRIDTDTDCGDCDRSCSECRDGACAGDVNPWVGLYQPRGIARNGGGSIYIVDANAGNGYVCDEVGNEIAVGLGDARWLAPVPGSNDLVVSGTVWDGAAAYGYDLALFRIPSPGSYAPASTHVVDVPVFSGEFIDGLAAAGGEYFYTTTGSDAVFSWDPGVSAGQALLTWNLAPQGLASDGTFVYAGSNVPGGELHWIQTTGGSGYYSDRLLAGTGRPSRLVLFDDLYFGQMVFWISADDGSVHAARTDGVGGVLELVPPHRSHSADVDITASAAGVLWSDAADRRIDMLRAEDWAVVPVAFSPRPFGIAATTYYVYWTDTETSKLYSTFLPFAPPGPSAGALP